MLAFPSTVRIFLAVEPVDMRKQFNGLWAAAQGQLGEDPFKGALFVFTNKRRNLVKMLFWDGSGVWVFAKRLDVARLRGDGVARSETKGEEGWVPFGRADEQKGRFSWPVGSDKTKLHLAPESLSMLLGGIDLKAGCKKTWYER